MWKALILVITNSFIVLQTLARPQNVQIEKQLMIEIPFGEFENGINPKHTPLFTVINQYFDDKSLAQKGGYKDHLNRVKLLHSKSNVNSAQKNNNIFVITKIHPMNNFFKKVSGENSIIQRRMSNSDNEIVELLPPVKDAPVLSYAKPIKPVLEEQLKDILSEYENLPKYNPMDYENVVKYERKLKDKDEQKSFKGRSQKSMKLTSKLEQSEDSSFSDELTGSEISAELTGSSIENEQDFSTDIEAISNTFLDPNIQPENVLERFVLKKGGIAIVGPKGIATAEKGGTAIVGPNGVAYTKPNGVAIVGPGSRVVSLPMDADLNKLVYELYKHQSKHPEKLTAEGVKGEFVLNNDGSTIKEVFLPAGGKIVATGPVIYHNNVESSNDVSVRR